MISFSEHILEHIEEFIFLLDADLRMLHVSRSCLDEFNLPEQEIKGTRFINLVYPEDKKRIDAHFRKCLTEDIEVSFFKSRMNDWSNSDPWYEFSLKKIEDNKNGSQFLLTGHPVGATSADEQLIIEREAALSDSEKMGRMGSWWVDIETHKNHWSYGNYILWGQDPSKPPPPVKQVLSNLHPEDAERISQAIKEVGETAQERSLTFRMMRPHHPVRHFLTRIRPWFIDGQLKEVKGVNFEITDLVKIQSELEENIRTLSQQNEKLTNYIFLNSHKVRKPLSNVLALLSLEEEGGMSDRKILALIREEIAHLDQATREINTALSNDGTTFRETKD